MIDVALYPRRIEESEFAALRQKLLATWHTGAEVDFDEAVAFHHSLPASRNVARVVMDARARGMTLIQPRGGVALIEEQISLLRGLQDAGADLLPTTLDSYTRNNRYEAANEAIQESSRNRRSMLNGFPVVNHGVKGCRRLVESVERPLVGRPGACDARLAAEVTLAAGFSDFEGGPIDYFFAYSKDLAPAQVIRDWQYIYRLAGLYQEHGVDIHQEQYGAITGTLVPPCLALAVVILEGLIAAEQGVHFVGLGLGSTGCLLQDVVMLRAAGPLGSQYLDRLGYTNTEVTTLLYQWMGAFPTDEAAAMAVISLGSAAAAFGRADYVVTKSPHEALGIPTLEANAAGVRATRQVLNILQHQPFPESAEYREEMDVLTREVAAIVDRALDLGDGSPALGAARAIEAGVIDIPFSPSRRAANRVLPMRDAGGAIRLFEPGAVPLPDDVLEFHRTRLARRMSRDPKKSSYRFLVDDIQSISRGVFS
jgi:methylaspartate mutase epsilon subunit